MNFSTLKPLGLELGDGAARLGSDHEPADRGLAAHDVSGARVEGHQLGATLVRVAGVGEGIHLPTRLRHPEALHGAVAVEAANHVHLLCVRRGAADLVQSGEGGCSADSHVPNLPV